VQALTTDHHPRAFGVQRLLVEEGVDVVGGVAGLVVTGIALGLQLGLERCVHCCSPG
jgi:hypothetical protein